MCKFLLGFLLALATSSMAVTEAPDGSIVFTNEEAAAFLANIRQMEADQKTARVVFIRMQKRIDDLEARRCL